MAITFVTGFNNTGKTAWIRKQIPRCFEGASSEDHDSKTVYYNYPESRLHPFNQAKLVDSYINYHNAGYDIYIETHSDHILNAIRVAVKQKRLNCEDVKILFFKNVNEIIEIKLQANGFIENWEPGFFDQIDKDLDLIFKY